jgi:formylglycine-generating enzyme required for sulfatase activity
VSIDSGLVAYWPMDEDTGSLIGDSSGNGNYGNIYGATWTIGISGSALSFDGIDDYVQCQYPGPIGTSSRTVTFWAKANSLPSGFSAVAMSYGGNPTTSGSDFKPELNFNSEGVAISVSRSYISYDATVIDNTWHFYSFALPDLPNPTVDDCIVYQDGIELTSVNGSVNIDSLINTHGDYPIKIGRYSYDSSGDPNYFIGEIDEMRVYDRALSPEEIQALYELDAPKGNILVYGTYDGGAPDYSRVYFDEELPSILGDYGYYVTVTDRTIESTITDTLLSAYDQIWILNSDSDPSGCFTQDELITILAYRNSGGGIFIAADHYGEGHYYQADANQVSVPLGVTFHGITDHGNIIPITPTFEDHPLFSGVTTILGDPSEGKMTIQPSSELVATYLGDSLIAVIDDGLGRVVFDVCLTRLFDDGVGGYNWITQGDTPRYVRNIADWLMETSSEIKTLWLVDDDGTIGDSCDCNEIQACIDSSSTGDTVLVYPGNYQNINFNGKDIVVGSRYLTTGDTAYIFSTIIDGDLSGSVVRFENGEGNAARICGFTITNGRATLGGGIYCFQSSPTINHNHIKNNTTTLTSTPDGGGIFCRESNAIIEYNRISNNRSTYGGGICCNIDCVPTITNNIIYACTSSSAGGGICLAHGTFGSIEYNLIYNNHSTNLGGGIYSHGTSANVFNNTLVNNSAVNSGGGIISNGTNDTLTVVNTILWENTAPTGPQAYPMSGTVNITYSDIEGGYAGEGNIDCDPLFCDPESGNFYLASNSWCLGTGEGGADIGAYGTGCGSISLYGSISGTVTDSASGDSIESVIVSVVGNAIADTTDFFGQYFIDSLIAGTYNISFSHLSYRDSTASGIAVTADDTTTLDMALTSKTVWFVDDDGIVGGDSCDCNEIQACIDSSSSGDIVKVLPGMYVEKVNFNGKNIILGSLFMTTGDTSYIDSTVIDGNADSTVVAFESGEDSTAVIMGFTIQNGLAQDHVYTGEDGGGIYCYNNSSPTISYNIIEGNIIINNSSNSGDGGGIFCNDSSNAIIEDNTISGNSAYLYGGGINCNNISDAIIKGNIINGNSSNTVNGGGIRCLYADLTITNNIIYDNTAVHGGGIMCYHSDPMILNNTISNNSISSHGGGIHCNDSSPIIKNTILWNNLASGGSDEIYIYNNADPIVTYSDISDSAWQDTTNLYCDPLFCDADSGNFYLAANSCCLGAGEGGADIGALGDSCDAIILYGSITGLVTETNSGDSIESVVVSVVGQGIADTTDSLGQYFINSVFVGLNSISFTHLFYEDAIVTGVSIFTGDTTTLNVELTPLTTDELMVHVDGGIFTMGNTWGDGEPDELPVHQVALSSFYLGKYEVTQMEYEEITGSNPSQIGIGAFNPVDNVSWNDIVIFCNLKSVADSLDSCYTISNDTVYCNYDANGYRLPTEAEWEFSARGGGLSQGFIYSGSDVIDSVAWYVGNSGGVTKPVGLKGANELGLHDMSGNIWEWCWDWYDDIYYSYTPQINPRGPDVGDNNERSVRGGVCGGAASLARVVDRHNDHPDARHDIGFRLCRSDVGYSAITGVVIESDSISPIAGVEVVLQGTAISDTTDSLGQYFLGDVDAGIYDLTFAHDVYESLAISGVNVTDNNIIVQDAIMGYLSPVLSLSSATNFGDTAFFPLSGYENTSFEFRINYLDPGNNPPQAGYPLMLLDWDGNGIIDHSNDDSLQMAPSIADPVYSDGVDYSVFMNIPSGGDPQVSFEVYSSTGESDSYPDSGWMDGPDIFGESSTDLYIYADDITFSTDPGMPDVGENIVISAKVHNNSPIPCTTKVNLYIDGTKVDSFSVNLPAVDGNGIPGQATVSFDTVFNEIDYLEIKFRVDPDSLIPEFSESNNAAARGLVVGEYNLSANIHIEANPLGSYYPSTHIGGSGSAWYEEEGAFIDYVSGTPVYLEIAGENEDLGTFYVNDYGNFYYTFISPAEPGTYNLEITITDFTLTSTVVVPFEVLPTPGPNLVIDFDIVDSRLNECDNNILSVSNPRIRNAGQQPADSSRAIIFAGDDTLDFEVPPLEPEEIFVYSGYLAKTHPDTGHFEVIGIADVDDDVLEEPEGNNTRTKSYRVWCCPEDLSPVDLYQSTIAYAGCTVNIMAKVYNYGGIDATNFSLLFEDISGGSTDTIGILTNLSLPAYDSYGWFTFADYIPADTGYHLIKVTADPSNIVSECFEDNNEYGETFYVRDAKPDLYLAGQQITVDNPDSIEGGAVTIRAHVGNSTCASADNFNVRFLLDNQPHGQDVQVSHLDPFSDTVVSHPDPWIVDYDTCTLKVVIDPADSVDETNEGNNSGTIYTPYDFATYYRSKCSNYSWQQPRFFNMCSATTSDLVEINVSIKNAGLLNYNDSLRVIVYDSLGGGTNNVPFDTFYVSGPFLHHNSNTVSDIITHQFAETGTHFVTLKLDSDSTASECNFVNNEVTYSIEVTGLLPDLVVQSEWINVSSINPDSGETLYIEGANIRNYGDTTASGIEILVQFDGDTLGTIITIESMVAGDSISIVPNDSVIVDSCYPRLHYFEVTADPSDLIAEKVEDNNSATKSVIYCDAPDLYIDSIYYEPECELIQDSMSIVAIIGNSGGASASARIEFRYLINPDSGWNDSVYIGHVYLQDILPGIDTTKAIINWDMALDSTFILVTVTDIYPDDYNLTNNDGIMQFLCRPYGVLSGCVVDTAGAPIESVLVHIDDGSIILSSSRYKQEKNLQLFDQIDKPDVNFINVVVDSIYTDTSGCFEFTVLADEYDLLLSHEDYYDTALYGIDVPAGDTIDTVVVLTPLPGILEGTVTDSLSDSIGGVIVGLVGYAKWDTTDSLGYYAFDSLAIGPYDVSFTHVDYESLTVFDEPVTPGDTTILNVVLEKLPGYLMGFVTDNILTPIESVAVIIEIDTSVLYGSEAKRILDWKTDEDLLLDFADTIYTNESGYYEVVLPDTVYKAHYIYPDCQDTIILGINVTPGDTTQVDVVLLCGCIYVIGDVNGSDSYNGLDITYGVNFFKYGTPVPQCADCPLCEGWHYCGDVNASCNYNGLDITYGVNYFKYGSPGPAPCGDCPPVGGITASGIKNEVGAGSILEQEKEKRDIKHEDKEFDANDKKDQKSQILRLNNDQSDRKPKRK